MIIVIIIIVAYVGFHVGHGHANVRRGRAAGFRPSVYWRQGMRGPWVSIRGPAAGFRVGHRL
jgi:hypothetical protein